ncbi:MAG: FHA domain-containing protein [Nostoc sp.]|uniref:FHA domain-containing protein n=1 Tax=Nostoc sp. TaxID=1180 RepID=UPI002FFB6BF9
MNTLPLQQWVIAFRWEHNGNLIDKKISKPEAERDNLNGAIIRIGRDKQSCNLYLEEISVSSQHAEIYCNEQQQKFFIKSLKPNIILQVDGQNLVYGKELPLKNNSSIVLGLQKLEVTNINIYPVQPTNYSGVANSTPNSIPVNSSQNFNQVNSTNSNTDAKNKFWQDKAILGVLVTFFVGIVTAGVTWYNNTQTQKTEILKSKLQTDSAEKLDYIKRLQAHKQTIIDLLKKDKDNNQIYSRLTLTSDCGKPINVAVSYLALNDIEETKGWFIVTNKRPLSPSFYTLKSFINIHAYIEDHRYKNLYKELKESQSDSNPWKQEVLDKYLEGKKEVNKEGTNYRNKQWKGNNGLVERKIIFPSDFDYIENPLFFDKDEKDIIDKVQFYAFKFNNQPSGSGYTKAKFSCQEDNLTLEIQN